MVPGGQEFCREWLKLPTYVYDVYSPRGDVIAQVVCVRVLNHGRQWLVEYVKLCHFYVPFVKFRTVMIVFNCYFSS